jgi:FAD/FMN-containing dehydrogenase/Fe-S oxidoreductase
MIPAIRETSPTQNLYLTFLEALAGCGFEGELSPDYANRVVLATDNSIYQVLPQGVIYPRTNQDLVKLAELSNMQQFHDIVLSPRGGGTGTNGQSLTDGLVVDVSKHMNQILEINAEEGWVRVQAGVVKDQLNHALKAHNLFFAPELSTSNRATIGGMINTDASGQGSCLYGKTRDHVLELRSVLLDGSEWTSGAVDEETLKAISARQDRVGQTHRLIDNIFTEHKEKIAEIFPPLNRCLTGYDLAHIRDEEGRFNLNSVLCGSEGTLGFISEAKLKVLPIPKFTALVNVYYEDFNAALKDAKELMKAGPTSIETVDSKVLNLAMQDIVWDTVSEFFATEESDPKIQGVNLVEYTADSEETLQAAVDTLLTQLQQAKGQSGRPFGHAVAWGHDSVKKIWAMRKKSVGLLGNAKGEARPIPFVEDTAVPPENLADFILEFRQVLDEAGLEYGMFGHVDAGVLHVRPIIDMKNPAQELLIRAITDKVVKLTQKYNGLLWGEHGKGVRSEYAPEFFGELYPQLQRIKAVFDPRNQLNPGKIATPSAELPLLKIDKVKTRGQEDRIIPVQVWEAYDEGMFCNGNGACFNWNPNDAMCPSWKGTRERKHSPKGRASLIREWLKQLSERGVDPLSISQAQQSEGFFATLIPRIKNTLAKRKGAYDFSNEVNEAMQGCLACKSCVGQCPVKVDVPEFRSKFLELYYGRYLRPLKDYFIGGLEFMVPTLARVPWLYNALMGNSLIAALLAKTAGMVDSPLLSGINMKGVLSRSGARWATDAELKTLSDAEKERAIILVQDAFTSYFETQVVEDTLLLLQKLGFQTFVAPFAPNGKPLHVHGFLGKFEQTANDTATKLKKMSAYGIPLMGIEPSMTLAYRAEYKKVLGAENAPEVLLVQEWLAKNPEKLQAGDKSKTQTFQLLAHCTEKTNAAASIGDWQNLFKTLGHDLQVLDVGCCGMAGTYGHETQNVETSKKIYQMSWAEAVNTPDYQNTLVASGYSCRSQVKRMDGKTLPHPLQVLLQTYVNH